MSKLRTAVIGCGKVAHFHAKAFQALPESQFVAVCDRNIDKARAFASHYNVAAYSSIEEMARDAGVQVSSVCTPHPVHAESAVRAASSGMHVLIEKPLASSLQDCQLILDAARKHQVCIGMVSQRRFYQPCLRLKQAIEAGKIGRPILATVNMFGWRDEAYYASDPWRGTWKGEGGGVLVNQAPHQLDLMLWYMGEVQEVYGSWANLSHPYIEVEDTAIAVVRFKTGALGNIVVSNSQNPALHGKVHVHGSNGASIGVQTDGGAMFIAGMSGIVEPPYNDLWTVPGEEGLLEQWRTADSNFFHSVDAMHYYHERQLEDFLRAMIEGSKPLVDGFAGRRTVELFTAIYRSNRDGKAVKFPLQPELANDFDGRLAAT